MSKTVTIPTDGMNPFVVISNGVKYVYTPGETVTVPDGVALEIEEYKRWRDKYYGITPAPFGAKPDLSQNDPDAADYVKGRTHYARLQYANTYLDYFNVNPNEVGIGIYPLVLVKEGKEGFDMEAFLSLENLQKPRALYGGDGDYDKQLVIRTDAFLNYTGKVMDLTFNGWFTKSVFIDELNYKCVVNSTYGIELYAIRDVNCLTEDYKDIYKKNGVYCKVTKDQSTVAQGYALNVSFEVLEYIPLAESYIPNHVPKVKTAKVGQTIVVEEVDDNGRPTAWEAAEIGKWEHICDITTAEEVESIEVTQNADGVPLSELKYNEIWVVAKIIGASTNTAGNWWGCYGTDDIGNLIYGQVDATIAGTTKGSWYLFIRGNKLYGGGSSGHNAYARINGHFHDWLNNLLDYYNADHFTSLKFACTNNGTALFGIDTEIRIMGRRA